MKKIFLGLLLSFTVSVCLGQSFLKWFPTTGTNGYATNITNFNTYSNGVIFVKFGNANTAVSSINVNSMGAQELRKWDGDSWVVLVSGDIKTETIYRLSFNASGFFELFDAAGVPPLGSALQVLRVNAAGNALEWATPSTGITNSAAANELAKSNGTNLVASGIFSTTPGSGLLGSTADAGTVRSWMAQGSSPNIQFQLIAKGASPIALIGGTTAIINAGGDRMDIDPGLVQLQNTKSGSADRFVTIRGAGGLTINNDGDGVKIIGGDAYNVSGDGNGGSVEVITGAGFGTGVRGHFSVDAGPVTIQANDPAGIDKGLKILQTDENGEILIEAIQPTNENAAFNAGAGAGGSTALIAANTDVSGGGYYQVQVNDAGSGVLTYCGARNAAGTIATQLLFSPSAVSLTFTGGTPAGLVYGADYSANYTTRSVVDKEFVTKGHLSATGTIDFTSTAAQTSQTANISVTGAAVGDPVQVGTPASPNANSCITAYVSAANTVTVKFNNYSSGAIDPASGSYKVTVFKY